ncbi:unnamed protein product [Withania somnifera]
MDELWKVLEVHESVLFDDNSRSNSDYIKASTVEDGVNEALPNIITSRRCASPLAYDAKDSDLQHWNAPEFECLIISNLIDEKETGSIVSDAPPTPDTKLYTDKCVKEYELPELVACYKESNYNIVKYICMDDSWNNAQQPDTYVSIPADDEDQHRNSSESADTEVCSAGGSKSSVEYENSEEEDTKSPDGSNPTSQDKLNNDSDRDNYLYLVLTLGSRGNAKWKHTTQSEPDLPTNVMLRPEESGIENSQQSKQPDQIHFEEAVLKSQNAVSAVTEANNSVPDTDLFYKSELGTEAIVFDFSPPKPPSTSKMDQGVKNILKSSNKSFRDLLLDSQGYLADGEASFSSLGPESGQIIYSGCTSSSERISVGSDSSTTSAGSFAFPILQSEWNSSPVRMGQALESKHFQKHRSWKQGILCCRF